MNYFQCEPELINLILPHTIDYARAKNIKNTSDIIKISCVCKDWLNWVYDQQFGPFRGLKGRMEANSATPYQGRIDHFNSLLKIPNRWFDFVEKCIELSKNSKNSDSEDLFRIFEAEVSPNLKAIDPNIRNAMGERPIITAIEAALNNIDMLPLIKILIQHGANPDAWIYHRTHFKEIKILPLWFVWLSKSSEVHFEHCQRIANALIQEGASINLTCGDENDHLLLHMVKNREDNINSNFILWFKEMGGNIEQTDKKDNVAFYYTLYKEGCFPPYHFSFCCSFIESSAKIQSSNKFFPLHMATRHVADHYYRIITLILEKTSEDVYVLDQEGYTPLYWAVKTGKPTFIELLTPYFKDRQDKCEHLLLSALLIFFKEDICGTWNGTHNMYSFIDGHCVERLENLYLPLLDKISSFLTRNGEKDYQQLWLSELDQENTFLHILARDAPYLLTEITRRQYFDSNLLQLENKKNETIHMLKDKAQNTFTLVKACFHIDIKAVQNLINQEINLNIQDKDGNSFLHAIIGRAADISSASFKNSLLIIDLLLNAGANPNHQNKKGDTPLHRAIITDRYYRHTEIMQRLCDKGANPLLKNLEGKTSLDLIGPSWHSGKRILQKALKGRLPKNL